MLQNQSGLAFGDYQLLSPVGWGGMSVVYHALQTAPESDMLAPGNVSEFAVKIMATNKEDSLSFFRRFQREVKVASSLAHPHILPICTYGIAHNQLYLVMPYMKSGTLEHRLKERKVLPLNETLAIAVQIGQALDYAHEQRIIHRDVKPHNILIGGSDQYYLADFGLVKILDGATRLTMSGHIVGTPAYMSPEQANGEPIDHRSDVYSLGIVLYECLVGRMPFSAETQAQAIGQHLSAQAITPSSVNPHFPKEVERVLMRALQKDPAKRYETAVQLAAALNRAAAYCKPAIRANPLVTLEQVERSRTRTASQARTTVRHTSGSKALWGAVGMSLILWLVLAVIVQTRLWNPEVVLAVIIQDVNAVQTKFRQTFLISPERTVLTHPIEHRPAALPPRPFQLHQDESLPETALDQGQRQDEEPSASGTEVDGGTQNDETSGSSGASASGSTNGSGSASNPGGSGNGSSNGNGSTNGNSATGNGSGNANGGGNAGGNGNGQSAGSGNGNGASDNGSGGTSAGGSGNGNASDGGNGSSNGNGSGQSTDTGNGNGSSDNGGSGTSDQGNGTSAGGSGNGNANGGGNDKDK